MKPTDTEIMERLNSLMMWMLNADSEDITSVGKKALALNLAMTVELIRRKYELTSAYYSTAEYAARVQYLEEYENGGK